MTCPKCSADYQEAALSCPECGYSVLKLGKRPRKIHALPAAGTRSENKGGKSLLFNNLVSYLKTSDTETYRGDISGDPGIGEMRAFGASRPAGSVASLPVTVDEPDAPVASLPEARPSSFQKFGIQVEPQKNAEPAPKVVAPTRGASRPPRKDSAAKFNFKKQFDDLFANHKPNQSYDPKPSVATGYAAPPQPAVTTPQYQAPPSPQTVSQSRQAPEAPPPPQLHAASGPQPAHAPNRSQPQSPPAWGGQFGSAPSATGPGTAPESDAAPRTSQKPLTSLDLPHLSNNSGAYAILGVMIFMIVGILGLLLMINL